MSDLPAAKNLLFLEAELVNMSSYHLHLSPRQDLEIFFRATAMKVGRALEVCSKGEVHGLRMAIIQRGLMDSLRRIICEVRPFGTNKIAVVYKAFRHEPMHHMSRGTLPILERCMS